MATAMSQTRTTDYRLGFQSLEEETAVDSLPVAGVLPAWLSGALIRVTPAKLEVGGRRLAHWFDGIAMLNRFGIAEGRVSYKSRFIDSVAYRDARRGSGATAASQPTPAARSSSASSRSSRRTRRTTRTSTSPSSASATSR